jgi:hypothetical protein
VHGRDRDALTDALPDNAATATLLNAVSVYQQDPSAEAYEGFRKAERDYLLEIRVAAGA